MNTRTLDQQFFTPAQIGVYLGISTYTVQELCRQGKLRHVKMGRSIRVRKVWADEYMERQQREPLARVA